METTFFLPLCADQIELLPRATRVTMGVVTGSMLVDGKQRDASFQRKTGILVVSRSSGDLC